MISALAARRLTIWRTWLALSGPPVSVQNSLWRPFTPSLARSASQSWITRDRAVIDGHGAVVVAFAVQDADGAAVRVDVGGLEIQGLLDPEAAAVEDGQQCPVPDASGRAAGARAEQRADFGLGEDLGGALALGIGHLGLSSVVNPSNRHSSRSAAATAVCGHAVYVTKERETGRLQGLRSKFGSIQPPHGGCHRTTCSQHR